jgi:acetoin utilization deacetylase AcuC-like enzyme
MALALVTSDRFADHLTPPGHPERVERAEAMQVVASRWAARGGLVLEPRPATDEDLARVHDVEHIAAIVRSRGRATMVDPDTFTSPESDDVARLAAGAVLTAVDHVLDATPGTRAFALVRPPGHHAEAERAMGFCLYNNVAVGAAWARARGLARVAVVDYDVHHGNGTQWMFYEDPHVLFMSSHQYPFYPGSGAVSEIGRGAGAGFTVNLPLEVGATDADFDLVYGAVAIPVLEEFRPELLLVSAGFDAHERDPLAGMRMTADGYGRLTSRLLGLADRLCDGRVVFVTEGGYDTSALAACCEAVIDLASAPEVAPLLPLEGDTRRGVDTVNAVRQALSLHWPRLAKEGIVRPGDRRP